MADFIDDAAKGVGGILNFLGGIDTSVDLADFAVKAESGGVRSVGDMPGGGALGKMGMALDAINLGKGGGELAYGLNEDGFGSDDTWQGIHDILSGGSGLLGELGPNPVSKTVGASFSTGMAIGDLMAPVIFGAGDENASKQNEQGDWEPSTGNEFIDEGLSDFGIDSAGKDGSLL